MDGILYPSAMLTSRHGCSSYSTEYNLSGLYQRFTAAVGFRDDSSTDYRWRLSAIAIENGTERELGAAELTDGQVGTLDLNVQGVRLFKIQTTAPDGTGLWCAPDNDVVVWANATLYP